MLRMDVITQRDLNVSSAGTSVFTSQDAVCSRVTALFNGATVATQGGFTFSILNQLRDFEGPASGTESHRVFEFSIRPMA